MGVYIKGMDIPTEGEYNMTLYVCSDGSAYMDVASFLVGKDKFEAVLVPPGRLIDADALKLDLTRFYGGEVTAKRLIDEQPTIIPVEEETK